MYKMTIDERDLLESIIADLDAEIKAVKADSTQTECHIERLIERMTMLQERLSKAEVVEIQDLGRPHYTDLLSTNQVKTPSEYQELVSFIQRLPGLAARTRARGTRWEEYAVRFESQICIKERELAECVVVPVSIIKRNYCETTYDREGSSVVVEIRVPD